MPRHVLNISRAGTFLTRIAKLVATISRINGKVSRTDLLRILKEVGQVVDKQIGAVLSTEQLRPIAKALRERIAAGWDGIRL
jgi:hypothetical protein